MKQIWIGGVTVAALALVALSFASNQHAVAQQGIEGPENVFAGKAIIITPTVGVAGRPKENVRVEVLADRNFLVYRVSDEDKGAYDYWMAADQVSRIRVFSNMEEATAFYDSRREKGVFH